MSSNIEPEPEMSFLDHLDELRRRLTFSAISIAIAFVLCFAVSDKIYQILDKPVREALQKAKQYQLKNNIVQLQNISELADNTSFTYAFVREANLQGVTIPPGTTMPAKIIRKDGKRLAVASAPLAVGQKVIPEGFELPVDITEYTSSNDRLVVHTLQGGFNLYVKVAFYAAFVLSVPFLLFQVWKFIEPGLYPHEKVYVVPFVLMATFFFLLGAVFAYYIAFPRAVEFLLSVSENFQTLIEVNEYFDLIITIILGLGLVFEMPTVVLFLARFGIVTPGFMLRFWRHALVAVFIIAALLSPTTDIPNMMVFAVPMMILYFFSVGIAWIFGKPRTEEAVEEAEETE
ncbi:MAG: twin-arginine translocase subunit TatC [Blastocatellia bacterium]|nr:twin-arginine translocase subunit TatC [Blastocatellia bacterium]